MKKTNLFAMIMTTILMCAGIISFNNVEAKAATNVDPYWVDIDTEYDLYSCGIVDFDDREIRISEADPAVIISFEVPEDGFINISYSLDEMYLKGSDNTFRYIESETDVAVKAGEYEIYSWLDHGYYYEPNDGESYDDFIINFTASSSSVEAESNEYFDDATELEGKTYGFLGTVFESLPYIQDDRKIAKTGDIDNYRFTLESSAKVTAIISDSNLVNVEFYSEDAKGNLEKIDMQANVANRLAAGSYFIKLSNKAKGYHFMTYSIDLKIEDVDGNFETEKNNTLKTANEIAINTEYTGSISTKKDEDYFAVTFENGGEVTFTTKVPREKANKLFSFTVMRQDSRGNMVNVEVFKSTSNPTIEKTFKVKAGTTYYLMVKSGNKKANPDVDYKFSFTTVEEVKETVVEEAKEEVATTIEVEADMEIELGETVKLPKFKGQKNVISTDDSIVSVVNGNKMIGNAIGTTTINFCDSEGNVLQSYVVAVVNPEM